MKQRTTEMLFGILVVLLSFLLSFIEYNDTYFLVSFSLSLSLIFYKEIYFLLSYLSIVIASFFIHQLYLTIGLLLSLVLVILLFIFYRKSNFKYQFLSVFISGISSFIYLLFDYYFVNKQSINLITVPVLISFLTYNFSKIILDFKSKKDITFTQLELLFLSSILGALLLKMNLILFDFNVSFLLYGVLLYILVRLNSTCAFLSFLLVSSLYGYYDILSTILLVLPLLFTFKFFFKHKKTTALLCFIIALAFSSFFNDFSYLLETSVLLVVISSISAGFLVRIEKLIIDPKDYKLSEFKVKYYDVLNKNKKVNSLIKVIEEKIKDNPRMKKKYNEKIAEDLSFLIQKIQNDVDEGLKEKILNELDYINIDLIGIKVMEDFQDSIRIIIEARNYSDYKKLMGIIENVTKHRFSMVKGEYNFLINSMKYEFINNEKYKFEYFVKQRSLDSKCGDNYLYFKSNNKKYFLLSDGMGHGDKANEDSKFALYVLKNLIELGMDTKKAIESCNALMYSKSDTYNTLDLLEYDCFSDDIYLYKNGSGNTYIQYDNFVDKLVSENLPLGIIDEINVKKLSIKNDVERILLTSDGINENLTEIISENRNKNVLELVNDIFRINNDAKDDQTIMAINIIKK